METPSFFERLNTRIRNSTTIKLLTMGLLILLLLIPALMIQDLIREREQRRQSAIREVSGKWGLAQTLTGPLLILPYRTYATTDDGRTLTTTRHAYFLPEALEVNGEIVPETRYRGIYEVVVYTSTLSVRGHFAPPNFADWDIADADILWQEATMAVGLSDLRGINENVVVQWNGTPHTFNPGVEANDVLDSGISTRVPVSAAAPPPGQYTFSLDLDLNGSGALMMVPLGQETTLHLASTWATPSFDGAFLPDEREVTGDGFTAQWRVLHLNRNYPQQWRGTLPAQSSPSPDYNRDYIMEMEPAYKASSGLSASAYGVRLLLPVDRYQKTMRAAKYAVLVIVFTFLTFFFAEIRQRERVHPFQYILVGLALCLFYALLLSLAEYMLFNIAYVLAGGATVALVALYARSIFHTMRLALITGGVLLIVYGFVFVMLQLEDYALLVGSIGLFVALALTMYLSRSIDWYGERRAAP